MFTLKNVKIRRYNQFKHTRKLVVGSMKSSFVGRIETGILHYKYNIVRRALNLLCHPCDNWALGLMCMWDLVHFLTIPGPFLTERKFNSETGQLANLIGTIVDDSMLLLRSLFSKYSFTTACDSFVVVCSSGVAIHWVGVNDCQLFTILCNIHWSEN